MTIPAIELLALLIVGPGVTRALMVVMVNQTDAGYAVGMCGMGFAFSLLCVRSRTSSSEQRHHTQNQFVNAEIGGDLAAHARIEVEHWSIQIVGRGPRRRDVQEQDAFSVLVRCRHLPFIRSYSSPLLFTACTQKMQRRRIRPRCCSASTLCTWRTSRLFDHTRCLCKTSRGSSWSSVFNCPGCALV